MDELYARSVFLVRDAERALAFYRDTLGFDWSYDEEGRPFVFQVSLLGFELIVNQTGPRTEDHAGHGRVFIGLDEEQADAVRKHIAEKAIETTVVEWGAPTLVIRDVDGNELFFWLPESQRAGLTGQPEGA